MGSNSPTRDGTWDPVLGAQSFSHWTIREVLAFTVFIFWFWHKWSDLACIFWISILPARKHQFFGPQEGVLVFHDKMLRAGLGRKGNLTLSQWRAVRWGSRKRGGGKRDVLPPCKQRRSCVQIGTPRFHTKKSTLCANHFPTVPSVSYLVTCIS